MTDQRVCVCEFIYCGTSVCARLSPLALSSFLSVLLSAVGLSGNSFGIVNMSLWTSVVSMQSHPVDSMFALFERVNFRFDF